jgi:hypothetical protein
MKGEPWIPGYPNLAVMSNIMVDGQPVGSLGYGEAVWHTDMSYNDGTPSAAILYGLEVTSAGGETGFLSMYHASPMGVFNDGSPFTNHEDGSNTNRDQASATGPAVVAKHVATGLGTP